MWLQSLPVSCLAWGDPAQEPKNAVIGLMMTYKRALGVGHCYCQSPCPHREPLSTHAPARDPPTLAGRSGSVFCGVTAPLPWVLVFVRALQEWSLGFPQTCANPAIKSHWPSKSDSPRIPCPSAGSPGWEAWCGAQDLPSSGRTSLVLLFSSLWVAHPVGMGFDFIVMANQSLPNKHPYFLLFLILSPDNLG